MNHALAEIFKSRLFHADHKRRTKDHAESTEVPINTAEPQQQPDNPRILKSIEEEERPLAESGASDDGSEESSHSGKGPGSNKFRSLRKRITSFPDLRFRSASSLSSASEGSLAGLSDKQQIAGSAKSPAKKWINGRAADRRVSSSPHLNLSEKPPIINITNDTGVSFEEESLKVPRKSSSEKRLSSTSITRISTASSAGSSIFARQPRRVLIRSNSDNCQPKKVSPLTPYSNPSPFATTLDEAPVSGITRRRSRTVGASDYGKTNISLHTGLSGGRVGSDSNLREQAVTEGSVCTSAASRPTHLRQHSSSRVSTTTSRRSSSLVNAISNFVSLRSPSVSSRNSLQKAVIDLEDLPKPPTPNENDTPETYLRSLGGFGKYLAVILASDDSGFKIDCLDIFLENEFDFHLEPLDISLRKLLMFLELPKESQQIDRVLTAFSKSYYKQNNKVCIWDTDEDVYSIVFSLLMLHTDAFNVNNKTKMTKQDFVKLMRADAESGGSFTPKEILEYFYDNVTSKEFSKNDYLIYGSEDEIEENYFQNSETGYSPKEIIQNRLLISCASTPLSPAGFSSSGYSLSPYKASSPYSNSTSLGGTSSKHESLDIYYHIASNTLASVTLGAQLKCLPLSEELQKDDELSSTQYAKYLSVIKETKGGYLRLRKAHLESLFEANLEVISPAKEGDDYQYLKIVQMGNLEELVTNRKFSLVGSVNRRVWKRQFGILTTSCLFLFNSMDWVEPQLLVDSTTKISNYIIDCPPQLQINHKFGCNGLFATSINHVPTIEGNAAGGVVIGHSEMYVYSGSKRFVFSCPNDSDRQKWIDSINVAAAFDGCFIEVSAIPDTVVTMRKATVAEKIQKLQGNGFQREERLRRLQSLIAFVHQSIPLNSKIRTALAEYLSQLEKRLDWQLYEIRRNDVYSKILKELGPAPEDNSSQCDTSADQSFAFSEDLERCPTNYSTEHLSDSSINLSGIMGEFR
ncbi:Arf family guanine nucleotide exchange factor SYT1 [Lachancea thermotolerans CBS 6340]|uniref:KLTH0F11000p n=1 Tax=Lachancea thermotolerans (strain ATCC 56472 / CBS 6340 / NRRL Y-8284) TaxID=559295 RepID=C5DL91_LACTC|nr:KLTH0F11000p [Lachancea thermotolerans CBS 6340]CAR24242.1 KLTH0F11000p [Lachancea thermotolerans CBS 6340]